MPLGQWQEVQELLHEQAWEKVAGLEPLSMCMPRGSDETVLPIKPSESRDIATAKPWLVKRESKQWG